MEHTFWADRWRSNRIAFHAASANPLLVEHLDEFGPPAGQHVLVPLCGKSHDLMFLAQRGFSVIGVEFVAQAAADFFSDIAEVTPTESTIAGLPALSNGAITIVVGDFFALPPASLGTINAIYDRAALVAVDPATRATYATKLAALATPGARLLLVNFVHDTGDGPPFSVPDAEVHTLFDDVFAPEKLLERDILTSEPRFRDRGATFMREQLWRGRRV